MIPRHDVAQATACLLGLSYLLCAGPVWHRLQR